MSKLLMPIQGDFIAPRFDLATEVIIARFANGELKGKPRSIIRERPSDEGLCQMAVEEHITGLVCGGIEELHYNFLVWKQITVIDGVISDWNTAMEKAIHGTLKQGDILVHPEAEGLTL